MFQSKEKKFWRWFITHSKELLLNDGCSSNMINELSKQLKKVHPDLTYEMSVNRDGGKKEFTVSADGDPDLIGCVEKLYDNRPVLQEWEIKKFRQRMNGFDIEIGNVCIKYDDTKYVFVKDEHPEKISILLFVKDFSEEKRDRFGNAAYIFVDCILGEYDVMKNIGFIDVFGFDSEHCKNAKKMTAMAAEFDAWKNSRYLEPCVLSSRRNP